jgi:ribonuclease R
VEAAPVAGALRFELLSRGKVEKGKRHRPRAEHEGRRKKREEPKSGARRKRRR